MSKTKGFLSPAVLAICFTVMFPSYASANVWDLLGIVKYVAGKIILPQAKSSSSVKTTATPDKNPQASTASNVPSTPPTQEEIIAMLDRLTTECKNLSTQGFPCAIGEGRGTTRGSAAEEASARAIYAMGQSMNAFVKGKADGIRKKIIEDGFPLEEDTFNSKMEVAVDNTVSSSQIYMTYTYTEQRERNGKPVTVYVVNELRILNAALFENALEDISKGQPVRKSVFDKVTDGIIDTVKKLLK